MIFSDEGSLVTLISMSTTDPSYVIEEYERRVIDNKEMKSTFILKQAKNELESHGNIERVKVSETPVLLFTGIFDHFTHYLKDPYHQYRIF